MVPHVHAFRGLVLLEVEEYENALNEPHVFKGRVAKRRVQRCGYFSRLSILESPRRTAESAYSPNDRSLGFPGDPLLMNSDAGA